MQNQIHVGLMLTHDFAYYRAILSGIRKFAETRPNWVFSSFGPEHLQVLRRLHPDALIAAVNSTRLAHSVLCPALWRAARQAAWMAVFRRLQFF